MDTDAVSAALAGAAARLEVHADALHSRAAVLARQQDAVRWQSPAARVCRTRTEAALQVLLAASGRLSLLAQGLQACAARLP